MFRIDATPITILFFFLLLSCWLAPTQAAANTSPRVIEPISEVNNNFMSDFVMGFGIAAGSTIAALILICTCAQAGPALLRRRGWFGSSRRSDDDQQSLGTERKAEKRPEMPFVQSSRSLVPAYA